MKIKQNLLGLKNNRFGSAPATGPDPEPKSNYPPPEKGQGLVETALILPVLLLLLLGVFEVGWALRGYLVLVNVNREATRFVARGIYLDFDEKDDWTKVGYEKALTHTLDSLSTQLNLDLVGPDPNGTMIITYYTVKPENFACPDDGTCQISDCSRFAYENRNDPNWWPGEDLNKIEYPMLQDRFNDPQNPPPAYYGQTLALANTTPISSYYYHVGQPMFSRIDPADEVVELRSQNNVVNCQRTKKGLPPTSNNVVIVENVYFQNQLVGLPFVTLFVPDPVPFYSHTAMRVVDNLRETAQDDITTCQLRPIIIPTSKVGALSQGDPVTIEIQNSSQTPGNFSFLHWDSTTMASNTVLEEEIQDGTKVENFKEPGDPSDVLINIGDWVESSTGANPSSGVRDAIDALVGEEIVMPVWNDIGCPANCQGQGIGGQFRVMTFVVMKVTAQDLTGSPKTISFEFSRFAPEACPGDDIP